jgi:DNA-binding NtrC family response regulator
MPNRYDGSLRRLTGEMNRRIVIDVPLGTSLSEIVDDAILQAVCICGGNLSQAARKLDVNRITVKRRTRKQQELARSENEAATGTGDGGAAIPSFPGGQGLEGASKVES